MICPKCNKPIMQFISGLCICDKADLAAYDTALRKQLAQFGYGPHMSVPPLDYIDDIGARLTARDDRIAALEDDLAINKNAYSEWFKRCGVVEAERDKARDALRPFADAYNAPANALGLDGKVHVQDYANAAALLCDGDKEERDEKEAD